VKAWLSRNGVPFTVRNVDEDDRAYDELIARGFRTVPVTVIGNDVVKGFDEAALMKALPDADRGSRDSQGSGP
jgi:glutaredoxin